MSDLPEKCLECTKAKSKPGRVSKLHLAPGINIFLVSLRSEADEVTHIALALSLEPLGRELAETLLNEQVARRILHG